MTLHNFRHKFFELAGVFSLVGGCVSECAAV